VWDFAAALRLTVRHFLDFRHIIPFKKNR